MLHTTLYIQFNKLNHFIVDSFKSLPVDEFLDSSEQYKYRYRRYGSAKVINSVVSWDKNSQPFLQSKKINKYVGGVSRSIPPLEKSLERFVEDNIILLVIDKSLIPSWNYSVGVHQIRITANCTHMGRPAPEGIHHDGFNYIAVACIKTNNIVGGTSILLDSNDYNKLVLEKELKQGEILVFNDKRLAHYTSPIVPKLPGDCYRDVIITTYEQLNL